MPAPADTLTSTLRLTARDRDAARVTVRRAQFVVGRPLELDSESPRIAALEYVLGGLAGEVVNGLRDFAWRRRIDIDEVEALVTGEVEHALAYLEVAGEEGRPALSRIHLKVFVAAPDETGVRHVWADVLDRLPLLRTLSAATRLDVELFVTV